MQNDDTTPRLQLRRMRGTPGSNHRRDRTLAILHDGIADQRTRIVMVVRRGLQIIVRVGWVDNGDRGDVPLTVEN